MRRLKACATYVHGRHLLRGRIHMFRNDTCSWSPCSRSGPGPSGRSLEAPVPLGPTSTASWSFCPLWTTVSRRPDERHLERLPLSHRLARVHRRGDAPVQCAAHVVAQGFAEAVENLHLVLVPQVEAGVGRLRQLDLGVEVEIVKLPLGHDVGARRGVDVDAVHHLPPVRLRLLGVARLPSRQVFPVEERDPTLLRIGLLGGRLARATSLRTRRARAKTDTFSCA